MKLFKRGLVGLLSAAMVFTMIPTMGTSAVFAAETKFGATTIRTGVTADITPTAAYPTGNESFTKSKDELGVKAAAGYEEGLYATWTPVSGATSEYGYTAYTKPSSGSSWTRVDNELIRKYPDYYRVDVLGLKSGSYDLKICYVKADAASTSIKESIITGLTVTAKDRSGFAFTGSTTPGAYKADGTLKDNAIVVYVTNSNFNTIPVTIKDSKGADVKFTGVQGLVDSSGIWKYTTRPLCIRILGTINTTGFPSGSWGSSAEGLQVKCNKSAQQMNLTIEGVGNDATLMGFGILCRQTQGVEIGNIGLIGFKDDGISLDTDNRYSWVHNMDIMYGQPGSDSDQKKGDGSLDVKGDSKYQTFSYNHFWDSGKMSLCGMTSETGPNYITYHHNWFDHSDSRHPRIRTMSVHVYNNYFDGNSKYGTGVTSGGDAFVESNYFRNCQYPMLISLQGNDMYSGSATKGAKGTFSGESSGSIKSYNNIMEGSFATYAPYSASQSGAKMMLKGNVASVLFNTTTDFDAYEVSTRTETIPSSVKFGTDTYNNFDTTENLGVNTSNIDNVANIPAIVTSKAGRLSGGDFAYKGTTYIPREADSTTVLHDKEMKTYATKYLAQDANTGVDDALQAAQLAYKPSLVSVGGLNGETAGSGSGSGDNGNTGSGDSGNTGSGDSGNTGSGDTGNISTGATAHNFTKDGTSSTYYTIKGSLSTSKGTVTYGGETLTQCLKMESATTITFTSAKPGTLTLVFGTAGNIKIDGAKKVFDSNVYTIDLAAGSHTISKADTMNLFYMNLSGQDGSDDSGNTTPGGDSGNTTPGGDSGSTTHTHSYTSAVTKAATCKETGVKTYTCTSTTGTCDKKTYTETIAKLTTHTYGAWVTDKAATATETGSKSRTCSVCGNKETETIPATGDTGNTTPGTPIFTSVGGASESIYAQISGVSDGDVTAVSYSGAMSGSLTGDDLKYLVRNLNGGVRIDIPGLKAGNYALEVTTKSGKISRSGIVVTKYDRSGYAHFNYTDGVGAYNDDGTLKPNAIVLYVTEENKNDVTVSYGGTTVKGIGNILNSAGQDCHEAGHEGQCKKVSDGKTVYAVANANEGIIRKLAEANIPLVVRIVGKVSNIVDVSDPASRQTIVGLTAYDTDDFGGTVGDGGSMARMKSGKNITIEGIGYDANVDGWGFHFMCENAATDLGKSFEVRNIAFSNVPEDSVGMEGQQSGSSITASVERCWIHNNSFEGGHFANAAESDKKEGDGSVDFKRGQYLTVSYNYFVGTHKTNLVGSSDTSLQYNLTYHHNIWYLSKARGPLTRQANVHMYNNAIIGQTDYAMQTRANAYIFSESNFFYASKNPQQVYSGGGPIKSYNDCFVMCIEAKNGTVVTDKSQPVTSNNKYSAFDTNPALSYIPSGNYELEEDMTELRKILYAKNGPMKENPVSPSHVTLGMISMIPSNITPVNIGSLPYTTLLGKSGKLENTPAAFTVGGTVDVELKFTTETAPGTGVLVNEAGVLIQQGSGTVRNLPAGTYMILPTGINPGSQTPLKEWTYKSCTLTTFNVTANDPSAHYHSYTSEITKQATCKEEGVKTYICTASGSCDKETYTEVIAKTAHNYGAWVVDKEATATESGSKHKTCSICGNVVTETIAAGGSGTGTGTGTGTGDGGNSGSISTGASSHNFTTSGKTSSYYNISGNLSTSKGTASYGGETLTQCLKMESATSITFRSADAGKLTLVFASTETGKIVKVDGKSYTTGPNGTVTVDLEAGDHTITKGDSINLFYINLEVQESNTGNTGNVTPDPGPGSSDSGNGNSSGDIINPDEIVANVVVKQIEAIETVSYTDDSKNKIDAARAAYDALTASQKALVGNYSKLTSAETAYKNLKEEYDKSAADVKKATDVVNKIAAIGTVNYSEASKNAIDAARNAYDALTDDQEKLVSNYSVLTAAEAAYAALEESVKKGEADVAKADAVANKIAAIGTVNYDDRAKNAIAVARAAYDALTAEQQALVSNYSALTAAESSYAALEAAAQKTAADVAKADAVSNKIAAIGTVNYTEAAKNTIAGARNAYDALTAEQKALVSNYADLTKAESAYAALEAAAQKAAEDVAKATDVINKIAAIGTVNYNDTTKNAIATARNAYDALTSEQKEIVANYSDLTKAEASYKALEEAVKKSEADVAKADAVSNKIAAIGTVNPNDASKNAIAAARTSYDELTAEQKKLVFNYSDLTKAEEEYSALEEASKKNEADVAKATEVKNKIVEIGTVNYNETSKNAIAAARSAYDTLTVDQKKLVSNYSDLTKAEAIYKSFEEALLGNIRRADDVSKKIDAIGTVTFSDVSKNAINNARDSYDELTEDQKNLVSNYRTLIKAEEAYTALSNANAVDVEKASDVINKITAIGTVAYDDKTKSAIESARAAYDALTTSQKALVSNYSELVAAETSYKLLKDAASKNAADAQKATDVINKIAAIGTVSYSDKSKSAIDAARSAYDALTPEQTRLVSNYSDLISAESAYKSLKDAATKNAADSQKATDVINKITAIGAVSYSDKSKSAIDAARSAYDALTADQKKLVSNYSDLLKAELDYKTLKDASEKDAADFNKAKAVVDKITAIGTVAYDDKTKNAIAAARTAYDALTANQKQFVSNYADLLKAELDYKVLEDKTPKVDISKFPDVVVTKWYAEYIQYVADHGIMGGYNDGTNRFGVNDSLTRAQFATMIYRMAGEPAVQFSGKFTDVPAGKYYSNAVEWCAANGIITGYKDKATNQPTGVFGTGDPITRQDLAVILYRYEGDYLKKDVSGQASFDKFTDGAKVSTYANSAMKWCVNKGIISGKNGVELDPKGNATRAEVAAMVTRFLK